MLFRSEGARDSNTTGTGITNATDANNKNKNKDKNKDNSKNKDNNNDNEKESSSEDRGSPGSWNVDRGRSRTRRLSNPASEDNLRRRYVSFGTYCITIHCVCVVCWCLCVK